MSIEEAEDDDFGTTKNDLSRIANWIATTTTGDASSQSSSKRARVAPEVEDARSENVRSKTREASEAVLLEYILKYHTYHTTKSFMKPPLKAMITRRATSLGWTDAEIEGSLALPDDA